jgi:hypothetical protein
MAWPIIELEKDFGSSGIAMSEGEQSIVTFNMFPVIITDLTFGSMFSFLDE